MTPKPGLNRAIPMAIIGFVLSIVIVLGIRSLQNMDPVWDTGVILVVAPFVVVYALIWGLGGLDPKMNQHPHGPEKGLDGSIVLAEFEAQQAHHEEAGEVKPYGILGSEMWRVTTSLLLLLVAFFAFAMLPTGLNLRTVNEAEADAAAFQDNVTYDLPFGLGKFQSSQLVVFGGFIAFTLLSVFVFAGAIGFLLYAANRSVAEVKDKPPAPEALQPPLPARVAGRLAGNLARALKRGIPSFFGQK